MSDRGFTTGNLFLIFLILKLTNVIDWSWVWVFSPLLVDLIITVITVFAIIIREDD